jgi:rare lipoprotein A
MMRRHILAAAIWALGLAPATAAAREARPRAQRGQASFYSPRLRGRRMANGERFDPRSDSAAHRSLPLGTRAQVTNLENGRSALVTVEDRGPHVRGRLIDLSPATADRLGMRRDGVVLVEVRPLGQGGG